MVRSAPRNTHAIHGRRLVPAASHSPQPAPPQRARERDGLARTGTDKDTPTYTHIRVHTPINIRTYIVQHIHTHTHTRRCTSSCPVYCVALRTLLCFQVRLYALHCTCVPLYVFSSVDSCFIMAHRGAERCAFVQAARPCTDCPPCIALCTCRSLSNECTDTRPLSLRQSLQHHIAN